MKKILASVALRGTFLALTYFSTSFLLFACEDNSQDAAYFSRRTSPEEDAFLEVLLNKSREARREAQRSGQEQHLLYHNVPPHLEKLFTALQSMYEAITPPLASQEVQETTVHLRRSVIALASHLKGERLLFISTVEGWTENEWPESERTVWQNIQELVKDAQGNYWGCKFEIKRLENTLLRLQKHRGNAKYSPFLFNLEPGDQDSSLNPLIPKLEARADTIYEQAKALSPSKIDLLSALNNQYFWLKVSSMLTFAMHTAQKEGWDNWSRSCFKEALREAGEKYDFALDMEKKEPLKDDLL